MLDDAKQVLLLQQSNGHNFCCNGKSVNNNNDKNNNIPNGWPPAAANRKLSEKRRQSLCVADSMINRRTNILLPANGTTCQQKNGSVLAGGYRRCSNGVGAGEMLRGGGNIVFTSDGNETLLWLRNA